MTKTLEEQKAVAFEKARRLYRFWQDALSQSSTTSEEIEGLPALKLVKKFSPHLEQQLFIDIEQALLHAHSQQKEVFITVQALKEIAESTSFIDREGLWDSAPAKSARDAQIIAKEALRAIGMVV